MPRLSWALLLLPLQLSIFVLLHVLYGLHRIISHINHRPRTSSTSQASSLNEDLQRWQAQKIPRHLAVAFTPGPQGWMGLGNDRRAKELIQDVVILVQWCQQAAIKHLSVYDAQGVLSSEAGALAAALETSDTSTTVKPLNSRQIVISVKSQRTIQLNILSPQDGKPFLAHLTKELGSGIQQGRVQPDDVNVPFLQQKVSSIGYDDPQLLIVLGGNLLKLRDYPPWTIRLTEI